MSNKAVISCVSCGGRGVVYLPSMRTGAPTRKIEVHDKMHRPETVTVLRSFPILCVTCNGRGVLVVDGVVLTDRDRMECEKRDD